MERDLLAFRGPYDNGQTVAGPVHIRKVLVHKFESLLGFRKFPAKEQVAFVGFDFMLPEDICYMIHHLVTRSKLEAADHCQSVETEKDIFSRSSVEEQEHSVRCIVSINPEVAGEDGGAVLEEGCHASLTELICFSCVDGIDGGIVRPFVPHNYIRIRKFRMDFQELRGGFLKKFIRHKDWRDGIDDHTDIF